MTVRSVGAMIIDVTRADRQSDQLSSYHPNGMPVVMGDPGSVVIKVDGKTVPASELVSLTGKRVEWQANARSKKGLDVTIHYTLLDDAPFLYIETKIKNPQEKEATFYISDLIRADNSFEFGNDAATGMLWAYDQWYRQAYGVIVEGRALKRSGSRGSVLLLEADGSSNLTLAPEETHAISRIIFPADHQLHLQGLANRITGNPGVPMQVEVTDPAGPVVHAKVTMMQDGKPVGSGRADADGLLNFEIPDGDYHLRIEAQGRSPAEIKGTAYLSTRVKVQLDGCGYVAGRIRDQDGGPVPCKIAFHGLGDTPTPNFGPKSEAVSVGNLHYSHNGTFRQEIAPGKYEVIISRGPEYDAVFAEIEVMRGQETELVATIQRVVDTKGWVSSDFHSHSTPSGDNTGRQLGRVLNLLCENIEFGPCTEHNRIDSYLPHLKRLGAEKFPTRESSKRLSSAASPPYPRRRWAHHRQQPASADRTAGDVGQ
jgi:hypothetical protein